MLRTQGGFCNRLRAIVSGILWAEDLEQKIAIYWPVELGVMPCRFADFFEKASVPELCCVHDAYLSKAHSVQSLEDMKAVLSVFGTSDEIRIESYSSFHPEAMSERGLRVLRQLRIQRSLEDRADLVWKELGGRSNWIGLHFRGTDGMTVGLEPFVQLVQKQKYQHFFLVSDEQSVKGGFYGSMMSDRVHSIKCHQGRLTPEQQFDAIIEWLLLQKTQKIYGSVKSSFSELAALRAGIVYEAISSAAVSAAIS